MTKLGMREKRVQMDGLLGGFSMDRKEDGSPKGWGFGREGASKVEESARGVAAAAGVREKLV